GRRSESERRGEEQGKGQEKGGVGTDVAGREQQPDREIRSDQPDSIGGLGQRVAPSRPAQQDQRGSRGDHERRHDADERRQEPEDAGQRVGGRKREAEQSGKNHKRCDAEADASDRPQAARRRGGGEAATRRAAASATRIAASASSANRSDG